MAVRSKGSVKTRRRQAPLAKKVVKDRIEIWRQAYEGDDNAICKTLTTFAWDYAAYVSVARAVEAAPEDETGAKQLNGMLLDLLRESYWGNALLAIRRLLDPSPLQGSRGVCSLRALITDVRACRDRLTRRVYVEDIAGLEYDYEAVERRSFEYLRSKTTPGPVWMPRELDYDSCRIRHEEFDFLSGVSETARSESDLIRLSVFDRLEARLDRLSGVAQHATIYFAHPATKASREGRALTKWGAADAKAALQLLTETAELVGRWFLNSGVGNVLPAPQYDQFAHMDKPMASAETFPALQQQWDEFADETAWWPMIKGQEL